MRDEYTLEYDWDNGCTTAARVMNQRDGYNDYMSTVFTQKYGMIFLYRSNDGLSQRIKLVKKPTVNNFTLPDKKKTSCFTMSHLTPCWAT
jgi:hypothetical protein